MERNSLPHLRAVAGPLAGRQYALKRKSLTIGRGEKNDIVLEDEALDAFHAKLVWESKRWTLINVGDTSQIFVRQIPVDRCELRPGQPVRIGSTMFELVSVEDANKAKDGGSLVKSEAVKRSLSAAGPAQGEFPVEIPKDRQLFIPGQAKSAGNVSRVTDIVQDLPSGLEATNEAELSEVGPEASTASGLAYSLFILALVLGGAVAINYVGRKPSPPRLKHVLVPEGEHGTIVSLSPYMYDQIGSGEENPRWQQIVEVMDVEPRIMVKVIGKNRGSVDVPLFRRGKEVLKLHITVRGKTWKEPPFQPEQGLEKLINQAADYLRRGKQLERNSPYAAIEEYYRPAVEFLEKVDAADAKALAIDAKGVLFEAEEALNARLSQYEHEFWQAYYLKDYARSLKQMENILEWVPNGSDTRHQRAAILAADIRRRIRLRSAK